MRLFRRRSPEAPLAELPEAEYDEFIQELRRPDERFWKGLVAINWKWYLDCINQADRAEAIQASQQMLLLTSQRLIVLHGPPPRVNEFPLEKLRQIGVVQPPGTLPGRRVEGMIRLEAWTERGWMECGWTAPMPVAQGFVTQLLQNVVQHTGAIRRKAPTAAGIVQDWIGWVRYEGVLTALDDVLEFNGELRPVEGLYDGDVSDFEGKPLMVEVPWSDMRLVSWGKGETFRLVFHPLNETPDAPWHQIMFLAITDFLRPGEAPWVDFLGAKQISIADA